MLRNIRKIHVIFSCAFLDKPLNRAFLESVAAFKWVVLFASHAECTFVHNQSATMKDAKVIRELNFRQKKKVKSTDNCLIIFYLRVRGKRTRARWSICG